MLCGVLLIILNTRHSEFFIACLMLIPPILSLIALKEGPDKEERKLARQLRKACLRDELKKLGVKETPEK